MVLIATIDLLRREIRIEVVIVTLIVFLFIQIKILKSIKL